uniref:Uncharacterized protein n=1 Tax=Eptatretus burgeri TaxID=7764 RepID=A0A8C4QXY2_EPTBU
QLFILNSRCVPCLRKHASAELWKKQCTVVMVEAADLSTLVPELSQAGVGLHAIVHEELDSEVSNFLHYFHGEVYLDKEHHFCGPKEHWRSLTGQLWPDFWVGFGRTLYAGIKGNHHERAFIAYADDICVCINHLGDVAWMMQSLDLFSEVSSAKINWTKTEAPWLEPSTEPILLIPYPPPPIFFFNLYKYSLEERWE